MEMHAHEPDVLSLVTIIITAELVGGMLVGRGASRGLFSGMILGLLIGTGTVLFLVVFFQGERFWYLPETWVFLGVLIIADVMVCGIGGWLGSVLGPQGPQARGAVTEGGRV
jgi:hypothetical protein